MHLTDSGAAAVMVFLTVCLMIAPARAETPPDAARLVQLRQPLQREAQVIRFMLSVSPFEGSSGYAECTIEKSRPSMQRYFESLYTTQLNKDELRQAVSFYGSKEGQEVVRLRLQHEQNIFDAARNGKQMSETPPPLPADVRAALDVFEKTSAGRFFAGEELEARAPFRGEIAELRSTALVDCFAAGGK